MSLGVRLRTDLIWNPYAADRADMWVAQDPIRKEFYYFSSLEKAIATSLERCTSIESVLRFARAIEGSVTREFIVDLLRRLDCACLLLHSNWVAAETRSRPRSISVATRISSLLALRIPIWNPSRTLGPIREFGFLLFHPWLMLALFLCGMLCVGCMLQRWTEIVGDVAAWPIRLQGDRLVLLSALILAIKGLHELGHAFACHWVGGTCREIGIMFFFGVPCLYCDVSDVWRIPNRWQRILVSAAGIYIELLIAMTASLVWLLSTEPWVQAVALQIVVLCTVVTVAFNANPLLRYDGYYILSDLMRIPNLSDQSREAWGALWRGWLSKDREQSTPRFQYPLALFHLASWCYRWFLCFAILWGLHRWLVMLRMPESAAMLAGSFAIALGWLGVMGWKANQDASKPRFTYDKVRVVGLMVVTTPMVLFLCLSRVEDSFFARGVLEPIRMSPVYANQTANLRQSVQDGMQIDANDPCLQMEAPELEREWTLVQGELQAITQRSTLLAARSVDDPAAAQQVLELSNVIEGMQQRIEKLAGQRMSLFPTSSFAGVFIDVTDIPFRSDFWGNEIRDRWTLELLAKNRATLDRGHMVGVLVDPNGWQVKAYVSEADVKRCQIGAAVQVRLDRSSRETLNGVVKSVSEESLSKTPKALQSDVLFGSKKSFALELKPEQPTYAVLIELENTTTRPVMNGLASVRIAVGQTTIVRSLWGKLTSLVYQATEL